MQRRTPKALRIPFADAIKDDRVLGVRWQQLSVGQRTVLKALYGLPLDPNVKDVHGWSELDLWDASQGNAEYDELGYIARIKGETFYTPNPYRELWMVCGRRTGKTDAIGSTAVVYEATCGGHEAYLRPGQRGICFLIAQDVRFAKNALHFIQAILEESPLLSTLIKPKGVTADRIDLVNNITIAVVPPSLKAVRGYANPITVMDEVGVWYQDSDSANPDYEIYRAVRPGQIQFPDRKLLGLSSPWNKAGLLHQYFEAGTNGIRAPLADRSRYKDCLVWHAPTPALGNPLITRSALQIEHDREARAYERECLAIFQDSVTGFLSPSLLQDALDRGVVERSPHPANFYVAAIDPAFRRDAFALTIVHAEDKGIVQDVVRAWRPERGIPLNPKTILAEMDPVLKAFKIGSICTDQYHFDSLQQLAMDFGYTLEGVTFTATSKAGIYGNLQQLLRQHRIFILDHAEQLRELKSLERRLTPGGQVHIACPEGMNDDLATVLAIASHKATWMLPIKEKPPGPEPTIHEQIMQHLKRKRLDRGNWD